MSFTAPVSPLPEPQAPRRLRFSVMSIVVLLVAGLTLAYGTGAYYLNTYATWRWVDTLLARTAEQVMGQVRQHQLEARSEERHHEGPMTIPLPPGLYLQVWYRRPAGLELIAVSPGAPTTALDPVARAAAAGPAVTRTLRWGERTLRVRTEYRVAAQSTRAWVVQVALDMTPWQDLQPLLVGVLVGGGVIVVGITAFVLEKVVRWMAWPMEQVGRLAREITDTEDLSRRLPIDSIPSYEVRLWAQAFNAAMDRLEEMFEQQRRFLADVSHELRTPLTIIRGQAELMRRTGQCDPEAVADIEKEAQRLSRLVEDLLFLARAEAGALPLRFVAVDLDALLLDVVRQGQVLAEAKNQRLDVAHLEPLPVQGDPDRLTQALLNLISNAVQYTPEGGRITVGARREDEWAVVWVQDTGPGIPPEDLPHVFERFYRADRSRHRRARGGFGLGLAIVKWIVEAHDGWVAVQSQVGRGSTFTLHLPLDPERAQDLDWRDDESDTEV